MTAPRSRRWLRLLPIVLVAGGLLGPFVWRGFIFASDVYDQVTAPHPPRPIPFERAKWDRRWEVHRYGMGKTLVADNSLIGLTADEVTARLGRPDRVTDRGAWWYLLGTGTNDSLIDYREYLSIEFDAAGRVSFVETCRSERD